MNKTLRLNNLKTRTATNAKISVFFICVEAIIYLLLYNLHECTFNHGISNDHCFCSGRRVYNTMIFFIIRFFFLSLTWRLLLCTNLHFLSLGDLLPLWLPWIYWTGTWWGWWSTSLLLFSNDLSISFYLLKVPSFKNVFSDLTPSLSNIKSYDFSVESSCILLC